MVPFNRMVRTRPGGKATTFDEVRTYLILVSYMTRIVLTSSTHVTNNVKINTHPILRHIWFECEHNIILTYTGAFEPLVRNFKVCVTPSKSTINQTGREAVLSLGVLNHRHIDQARHQPSRHTLCDYAGLQPERFMGPSRCISR